MRILVACEMSGRVRDAFRALGHDAWSCDLLPDMNGSPYHLRVDWRKAYTDMVCDWECVIAFPPCTDLCCSGARWFPAKRADGRQQRAIDFFMEFTRLDCKWCIENPVGIMSTHYREPDQIIQPYNFGEDASKQTCLWLNGLPKLQGTEYVQPRIVNGKKRWANQSPCGANKLGPSPERSMLRSLTFLGIADAMAQQWGK